MEKIIEKIPTWAINFIVNGEADNLTDDEIKEVKEYYKLYELGGAVIDSITPKEDENGNIIPYITLFPAFGKDACEVEDCEIVFHYINQDNSNKVGE